MPAPKWWCKQTAIQVTSIKLATHGGWVDWVFIREKHNMKSSTLLWPKETLTPLDVCERGRRIRERERGHFSKIFIGNINLNIVEGNKPTEWTLQPHLPDKRLSAETGFVALWRTFIAKTSFNDFNACFYLLILVLLQQFCLVFYPPVHEYCDNLSIPDARRSKGKKNDFARLVEMKTWRVISLREKTGRMKACGQLSQRCCMRGGHLGGRRARRERRNMRRIAGSMEKKNSPE